MLALVVPFGSKAFFKHLICKDTCLGKTIHPFTNLNVNLTIRSDNVTKFVVDDDFIGDDVRWKCMYLGFDMGGLR